MIRKIFGLWLTKLKLKHNFAKVMLDEVQSDRSLQVILEDSATFLLLGDFKMARRTWAIFRARLKGEIGNAEPGGQCEEFLNGYGYGVPLSSMSLLMLSGDDFTTCSRHRDTSGKFWENASRKVKLMKAAGKARYG